ncbi:MAG: TonB-dependent receptor [Bdellovibrionaceae bacterium]|nr:TonB-dependent receptor [Pseudobdellovibrionaceae bacterium]
MGLLYDITPDIQAFFNASRSFEPPSFGELKTVLPSAGPPVFPNRLPILGTQNLDAQSATTLEIGTRGAWNLLAWDLAFYHAWVEDELLSLNDPNGTPLGTINASSTRHLGVEAALDATLWSCGDSGSLTLRQVYNWNEFVFDDDPTYDDNQIAGLPAHVYRADLLYRHPCGFYAGPNVEWIITKWAIDHANSFHADPYALLGWTIGYRSERGFSVFFEAKNLTDKEYAATTGVVADALGADSAQFLPGDGLSVYGGIEWKY